MGLLLDNAFQGYDLHYARMGNTIPDWAAAVKHAEAHACRKPWLPASNAARILDFGCGWGHQLLSLWCAGYRSLEGVEVSPEQARQAQCSAGGRVPISCRDGRDFIKDRPCTYDLIILNDVLEHILPTDALSLLQDIRMALTTRGRVVVRVPNMSSLLAAYSRYMDITHVAGYTEWSLFQLLDQAGFVDHRLVDQSASWAPATWRPWAPLRGLGLRCRLNRAIHRVFYVARSQSPMPKCLDYNLEVYSVKRDCD
jgi:SAM-dependent methyltransferase